MLLINHGVPANFKAHMETLKKKGNMAIIMSPQDNMSITVWHDSKVTCAISNCHTPLIVSTHHQMKGQVEQTELPCPLMLAEYNRNMGAINDFDCLMSFLCLEVVQEA